MKLNRIILVLILLNLPMVSWGAALAPFTESSISHPYVISYEGAIEGNADSIVKSIFDFFNDIDKSKVNNEIFYQNVPGTNIYTIEAFIESQSEQAIEYVQSFVSTHQEYSVGNIKLKLRPANHVVEFLSMSGFGPNQAGNDEIKWGTFTRTQKYDTVSAYTSKVFDVGFSLGKGQEKEILETIPKLLNPTDTYIFTSWISGLGSASKKLSRLTYETHSFFVMEDGTYVTRALSYGLNRKLGPQSMQNDSTLVESRWTSSFKQAQ